MTPASAQDKAQGPAGSAENWMAVYQAGLRGRPFSAEEWFKTGNGLHSERRFPEAVDCYRRCLALGPGLGEAYYNLGNTCLDLGRHAEAHEHFLRCIAIQPENANAHFNLGIACFEDRRLEEAIAAYRQALELRPGWAEASYNLGIAYHEHGRLAEAAAAFRDALKLRPDFPEGHNNLGIALKDQGLLDEAAARFEQALALHPAYADALYNLGGVRHQQHRLAEAVAAYQAALAIRPDHHKAWNNLAKAHQDRGELAVAVEAYGRALSVDPDYAEARFNLSTARLLSGNYLEAWPDYEARFRRSDWQRCYPHRLSKPRWNGEPFPGRTLLVHCEQGFGDMFQFVRYLPLVKSRGGRVLLETRRPTLELFKGLAGVDQVVPFTPTAPPAAAFDLYVPLLSLPGIFDTRLETIPCRTPYLEPDLLKVRAWSDRFGSDHLRVGLVWAGTAVDPHRASPLAWFAPLSRIEGLKLYGLQKGPAADLLVQEGLPSGMTMKNFGPELGDFSDTAAALAHLDLLLTIDTSVAHLAGAMGIPVYLLLPVVPDWRWMLAREDSPWYPSFRLFRQETPGDWGPPLTRVVRRMDSLARNLRKAAAMPNDSGLIAGAAQLHAQGELVEASMWYRRLLRTIPDHPEGLHGEGVIALQTRRPDRAAVLLQKALDQVPRSDRFSYHMGLAFLALDQRDRAARAFRDAIAINPHHRDAAFNLGLLTRSGS